MQVLYIALAILSGAGISMQASMLGAIGTARTPAAAVWISLLATVVGLTSFVAYRTASSSIGLPPPFDRPYIMIVFAIAATIALAFSARDIEWYYVLTGLMPIPFLIGAGFLAPRTRRRTLHLLRHRRAASRGRPARPHRRVRRQPNPRRLYSYSWRGADDRGRSHPGIPLRRARFFAT